MSAFAKIILPQPSKVGEVKSPEKQPGEKTAEKSKDIFWREFVRVQSDKFILLLLIVILIFTRQDTKLTSAAIGGLIVLIQGQRFKLS